MKGRRVVLLAASAIAGLGILAPIARAESVTFDRVTEFGTVDFGDWVHYELTGTGCAGHTVRAVVDGPAATDAVSAVSTASPSCDGAVRIPTEREVRETTGWTAGAPVAIRLVSGDQSLPLRYERVEVDQGTVPATGAAPVAGTVP